MKPNEELPTLRVVEIEAALRRYADPEMWQTPHPSGAGYKTDFLGIIDEIHRDGGALARAALARHQGEDNE